MFELLATAANFAGMAVSMDNALFHFTSRHETYIHFADNLYKVIRWGGFNLETMPHWDDTPLGRQESEALIHVQVSALEVAAELRHDATGVDCFERYDGIDQ